MPSVRQQPSVVPSPARGGSQTLFPTDGRRKYPERAVNEVGYYLVQQSRTHDLGNGKVAQDQRKFDRGRPIPRLPHMVLPVIANGLAVFGYSGVCSLYML
jgi:hypothetical protein